jgi:uncharacterized protein (TIGR01777 family)
MPQPKAVIAGGTGLLGRALASSLASGGYDVVVLTRDAAGTAPPGVRLVAWDADGTIAAWAYEIDGADVVVNLAGASLADRRWTPARKALLRDSRLLPTRSLVTALRIASTCPRVWLQGSGVAFYGAWPDDRVLDESSPPGTGFLADLAREWEAEAQHATAFGCRVAFIRTGVVLSSDGGALPRLARPFRWYLGGPVGSGRQYLSWIHIDDWTALMRFLIDSADVAGAINATAPTPVSYRELAHELGRALGRPSWLPVPGPALTIALGEMAGQMLLNGQRVQPARALTMGFRFRYPTLAEALTAATTMGPPRPAGPSAADARSRHAAVG